MPKTILEELDELENGDECPVSNRVFARFMRHLLFNHLAHMQRSLDKCRWNDWILFGALGLIISILVAMFTIMLTSN